MRTSNLLPEECKAEIRRRIAYAKKVRREALKAQRAGRYDTLTGQIVALEWVLNDKEG